MKAITKLAVIILAACMLISFCAGCRFGIQLEPVPYSANNMELYTIAAFSIPYADEMGTSVSLIEKDSWGRKLFCVRFGKSLFYGQQADTGGWMYAFVICQKSDKEKTYYYEDECFRIYQSNDLFTENEQRELKERNDWNCTLNDDKMCSRRIIKAGESKLSATVLGLNDSLDISMHLDDLFRENHSFDKQYLFSDYLDCDSSGKSLGIVWGYSPNEAGDIEVDAYFVMVDKDCLDTKEAKITKINDSLHFWTELKQFKADNGWG